MDYHAMPVVSRFYGIVVRMNYREHNPPHFHVDYSGHRAVIGIDSLQLLRGQLPTRALNLVLEWAHEHQGELAANWQRALGGQAILPIEPLE